MSFICKYIKTIFLIIMLFRLRERNTVYVFKNKYDINEKYIHKFSLCSK